MLQLTKIELFKEDMKFSAGHFTIFSKTQRENLHGHNYRLYVSLTTSLNGDGLSIDYRIYKEKIRALCKILDEIVIIPGKCEYLIITEKDPYLQVEFNAETMIFLKRDVIILPIKNVTVEELSNWFIQQLIGEKLNLAKDKIFAIKVKIFSGPGQSASASWKMKGNKTNE